MRSPNSLGGHTQLRCNDRRPPDAALRHGTDGPKRRPVGPGHSDRSRSVHRRVPGSIAGGRERARLPLHPSQRDRDSRANGIRWHRRRASRPPTRRRCGSHAAVLPADRERHGGNVRILNGHGSCAAPPPSLQGSPLAPISQRCALAVDVAAEMLARAHMRVQSAFGAKAEVGFRGCQGGF